MFSTLPAAGIAGRFLAIIDRLCRGLAAHAVRDWTATAFVHIIVANLRRRAARFVVLKARFDAGLPPPPARPARERPAPEGVYERAFDFVPRERGWLKRTTEHDGAAAFGLLRDLLTEPEMAAFIAADPRVGRLLRPLWWMLSPKLGLPEVLMTPPVARSKAARSSHAGEPSLPKPERPRRFWVRVIRRSGSGPPVPA